MDFSNSSYLNYLPLALLAGFLVRRWFKFRAVKAKLPEYIKNGAIVVDVRTPAEYALGHFAGSINLPLGEIGSRTSELDKNKTILLCCASGSRSGMATTILKAKGFSKAINAGPWSQLL